MLSFIFIALCIVVGICFICYGIYSNKQYKAELKKWNEDSEEEKPTKPASFIKISLIPFIIALVLTLSSMIYTQEVGQVILLRNWGGSLAGTSVEAGVHIKAPWQDVIHYNTRNNILSFLRDNEEKFGDGSASGPRITIYDKNGTSATIDLQINYSLDPSAAEDLYSSYRTQENFVKSICVIDARAIPREVSGQFDTITILSSRGEFTNAIQSALTEKWKKYGLVVEQVSIQNVIYPDAITEAYTAAQSAEIAKAQALNEQETARVEAETKIIQADGDAEANRILNSSLTQNTILYYYILA